MNTRRINGYGVLGIASIFVMIGFAGRAEALPLVDRGDTTLDPNSGLEWLDVSLTTNRSFADISLEFGVGGDFEGFRHATPQELVEFFTNAGIPEVNGGFAVANAVPVGSLLLLVGTTDAGTMPDQASIPGDTDFALAQGNTDDMFGGLLELRFNRTNGFPPVGYAATGEILGTDASLLSGHWLVRSAIDAGLFTQNGLRQCGSSTVCFDGDTNLQRQSDFDLSVTGSVSTLVSDVGLGAQSGTSAGYDGIALTPSLSAYAYTAGPQRFTAGSFGFQRYEFLNNGQVTIGGTLTYSQTGETAPEGNNPRGIVEGVLMGFQMDGDVFDPNNCNVFPGVSSFNASGFLLTCLSRNGEPFGAVTIDFVGLQNYQESVFDTATGPVSNGVATAELTIAGQAGDVFFLAASQGVFAHLGGFADSGNTLSIDIDQPQLLAPTFTQETFSPAPRRNIAIDIDPGSDSNCLNINGHGKIPVAVLGSDEFDILDIDQMSLTFAGLDLAIRRKTGPQCNPEYSNGDEFLDLVCKFEDDEGNWSPDSSEEASVLGGLIDGRPISGTDSICIVP